MAHARGAQQHKPHPQQHKPHPQHKPHLQQPQQDRAHPIPPPLSHHTQHTHHKKVSARPAHAHAAEAETDAEAGGGSRSGGGDAYADDAPLAPLTVEIENEFLSVGFDGVTGRLAWMRNKEDGESTYAHVCSRMLTYAAAGVDAQQGRR